MAGFLLTLYSSVFARDPTLLIIKFYLEPTGCFVLLNKIICFTRLDLANFTGLCCFSIISFDIFKYTQFFRLVTGFSQRNYRGQTETFRAFYTKSPLPITRRKNGQLMLSCCHI